MKRLYVVEFASALRWGTGYQENNFETFRFKWKQKAIKTSENVWESGFGIFRSRGREECRLDRAWSSSLGALQLILQLRNLAIYTNTFAIYTNTFAIFKYAPSAVWQIQLSKSSLAKKGGIHISVVSCTVLGIDTRNLFSSRNKPLHFGQTRHGQLYIWQFRQMEFAIWSNRGEKEWRSADRDPPLLGRPSPITPRLYISHSTFHKSENVEFTFCPYFSS